MGGNAGTIFTQPMFFSPLHTPQNWQIASKRKEVYQWFYNDQEAKHIYVHLGVMCVDDFGDLFLIASWRNAGDQHLPTTTCWQGIFSWCIIRPVWSGIQAKKVGLEPLSSLWWVLTSIKRGFCRFQSPCCCSRQEPRSTRTNWGVFAFADRTPHDSKHPNRGGAEGKRSQYAARLGGSSRIIWSAGRIIKPRGVRYPTRSMMIPQGGETFPLYSGGVGGSLGEIYWIQS